MNKYMITRPIKSAHGHQSWIVEAPSLAEALAILEAGGGEFAGEEVEVTGLGEPEVEELSEAKPK